MIIYIFLNISYNLFSNKHMKWTEPHDIYFLRDMMLCQPWEHKKGSTEREKTWARLAANLIKCSKLVFYVTQRSPRDRYLLLERKHNKKVFDEENSSGISPEDTEIDQLMNEIVDLLDEKLNLPQICLVQICCKYEICKALQPVQRWQSPNLPVFVQIRRLPPLHWLQSFANFIFATYLHQANLMQIRFFVL